MLLGPTVRDLVREAGPAFLLALITAGAIAGLDLAFERGPSLLAAQIVTGAVVYVVLVVVFQRERTRELLQLLNPRAKT
jgi:hypothetical protein